MKANRRSLNELAVADAYGRDPYLSQNATTPEARAKSNSVGRTNGSFGGRKRSLGEPVGVRALSVGRAKEVLKLFDILQTNDYEMQNYVLWMKRYLKLYKAMFHKYATVSSNKINIRKVTFDDMKDQQNSMSLTEVFAFLNDFKILNAYGSKVQIRREDIKNIIKMINLKNSTQVRS
jgi:hypothetical protein